MRKHEELEKEANHFRTILLALFLIALSFGPGLTGQFVYDDKYQIVRNIYIQDGRYYWKALTSDVWAFQEEWPDAWGRRHHREKGESWSNYWRPAFISWLIINFRLFGLNPLWWHLASLGLHAMVCIFIYLLLLQLGIQKAASAGILWLFAVHPIHVESVTWISGSTDLLVTTFLLASLLSYLHSRKERSQKWKRLSLFLYILALLSKEIAIFFPGVVFFVTASFAQGESHVNRNTLRIAAFRASLPYLGLAIMFLVARSSVLEGVSAARPDAVPWSTVVLTMPLVFSFYVLKMILPFRLGPTYSLEPVANVFSMQFVICMAIVLLLGFLLIVLKRTGMGTRISVALALFVIPLIPAFYIRGFRPQHFLHDRYLYLPLFGFLMLFIPVAHRIVGSRWIAVGTFMASILLSLVSFDYSLAYRSDLTLWRRAVTASPTSDHAWFSLAESYHEANELSKARRAYDQVLRLDPHFLNAAFGRSVVCMQQGDFDEAEKGFQLILKFNPYDQAAIDNLFELYFRARRPDDAVTLGENARRKIPYEYAKYTANLSLLYFQLGKKDQANQELTNLESLQHKATDSDDPDSAKYWYFLGAVYQEAGRPKEAIKAAHRYLELTSDLPASLARYRKEASALIKKAEASEKK